MGEVIPGNFKCHDITQDCVCARVANSHTFELYTKISNGDFEKVSSENENSNMMVLARLPNQGSMMPLARLPSKRKPAKGMMELARLPVKRRTAKSMMDLARLPVKRAPGSMMNLARLPLKNV